MRRLITMLMLGAMVASLVAGCGEKTEPVDSSKADTGAGKTGPKENDKGVNE